MTESMWTLAESYVLMSWFKPLLFTALVGGWAYTVSWLDKDVAILHLQRNLWNCGHIAAGALAVILMLFIPWFWLMGLPLGLLLLVGPIVGYVMYRNTKVEEHRKWYITWQMIIDRLAQKQQEAAQTRAEITLLTAAGQAMPVPGPQDPIAPIHAAFETLLEFALPRAAESIEILVTPQKGLCTINVDGMDFPQPELEPRVAVGLVDYLKQAAALDLQDRRRLQTGRTKVRELGGTEHVLAMSTSGSTRGLNLTIQIDPNRHGMVKFDDLGLLNPQKQALAAALEQQGKVVIVACPPKQGMTTTLYSLLDRHDPYTLSLVTLEDNVSFELEGVTHNVIEPGTDVETLNQRLTAMLRRDPSVLMLSKVTDSQIAQTIVGACEEVRFYIGLYMEDTFQALMAWKKAIGDGQAAADSLAAIISPRLFRRLCLTCRQPYQPDAAALRKMNLPDKVTQLYRQSGQVLVRDKPAICPACHGLGYRGRSAMYEVLVLDDGARQLLAANQMDQLRAYLRKQRMLYLSEVALAKVVEGATSIAEASRVLAKPQAGGGQQAQAAASGAQRPAGK